MFNDITRWESQKVQAKCVVWAGEKVVMQQDSDLVIGVSVIQDRKRLGKTMKSDHFTNLLTEDGTISRFG